MNEYEIILIIMFVEITFLISCKIVELIDKFEHDKEIISKIDEAIDEKQKLQKSELNELDNYKDNQLISDLEAQIVALTELKQKLNEN